MYPVGTRIELKGLCDDERDMPPGLRGTVVGMDDQPALLKHWDNGINIFSLLFQVLLRAIEWCIKNYTSITERVGFMNNMTAK